MPANTTAQTDQSRVARMAQKMVKPYGSTLKSNEHGSALAKALTVLNEVVERENAVGLADLAQAIDLPRQTIHRILQQLVEAGLLIRGPNKDRYIVGPELTRLSASALANVQPPIRAMLTELACETGETCNVGVLDHGAALCLERVYGSARLRLELNVGGREPIHCTAIGKCLVAYQRKDMRTNVLNNLVFEKFTARTLVDVAAIEQEFASIRSQGYSFSNEEYFEGLTAVAVPIIGLGGRPVAALAIQAPRIRMDVESAVEYLPSMRKMAARIAKAWALQAGP